jgi:hypothetical protein
MIKKNNFELMVEQKGSQAIAMVTYGGWAYLFLPF